MIFDTNLILHYVRKQVLLPERVIIPIVVAGELEALALKNDWGYQKVKFLQHLLDSYLIADLNRDVTRIYAEVDAYSQNKSKQLPLPIGVSARNMGKNDLWRSAVAVASIALYLDMDLHTLDNDFNHLTHLGLMLVKPTL